MKFILQFVDVMVKLIQMIVMPKMLVSLNGLKVSVNEKKNYNQAPHSWDFMLVGLLLDFIMSILKIFISISVSFIFFHVPKAGT